MPLDAYVALVLRLTQGILAIQAPGAPVAHQDAVQFAMAAAHHAQRAGVDPFELIGIARNESDFRPRLVGPDGKDCGLMQTRILYSRYRCRDLRGDPWLSFEEGARRLGDNQRACRRDHPGDLVRCRLNRYNSGVRYARKGRAGGYWLRVTCFAEAARLGVTPAGDCREVLSRREISRLLARSQDAPPPREAVASKAKATRRAVATAKKPRRAGKQVVVAGTPRTRAR